MSRQHGWANIARFVPGRKPRMVDGKLDDRIKFSGARYSRQAMDTPKGFIAGGAVGPGLHRPKDLVGSGFELNAGGVIVPARPNEKYETVPVRDFHYTDEKGEKRTKQFMDLATFQTSGTGIFEIVPYQEDNVFYWEIWTGDILEEEATFQLIQADMFRHGAVEYIGGSRLIDAPSEHGVITAGDNAGESSLRIGKIRNTAAKLMAERPGPVEGGIELWHAYLYACRFSPKDSEALTVRQNQKFYLLTAEGGKGDYQEVPAEDFEEDFEENMAAAVAAQLAA